MSPTATGATDAAEQPRKAAAPEPAQAPAKAAARTPWQIVQIGVELIDPSPYQPRLSFDPSETAELVASVRERGVQQPILVRTAKSEPEDGGTHANGEGSNGHAVSKRTRYELIAGERRLRACKEAGRKQIPAIIRNDLTDRECAELALLENIQRSNLSVIEEARGYKQLMLKFGMKEERIARKVGKSVQTIQAMLRLLQLPELVQHLLAQKKLSASHGQELLALSPFERVCTAVAQHASDNRVTALSLQANPLPNALDLKRKGLLEELDYKTKFDWRSTCQSCPHKAFLKSGYASYCLKPEEWKRKQEAAVVQQKDEATRAMQQVREQIREQEQDGQVDTSALPPGSYRNLSVMQVPVGCGEHCPCRRETCYPNAPDTPVSICVDPARLKSLQEQERQAHEDARRRHFTRLLGQADQVLEGEKSEPRKMAALLTSVLLVSELHRFGYDAEEGALVKGIARGLGLSLPWDELLDGEDEGRMLDLLAGDPSVVTLPAEEMDGIEEMDGVDEAPALAAESSTPPPPGRLLLLCASLLLAQEARRAVRWGGDTPRLGFVLGPDHQAQLQLPTGSSEPESERQLHEPPSQDDPSPDNSSDEAFALEEGDLDWGDADEDDLDEDDLDEDDSDPEETDGGSGL